MCVILKNLINPAAFPRYRRIEPPENKNTLIDSNIYVLYSYLRVRWISVNVCNSSKFDKFRGLSRYRRVKLPENKNTLIDI